MKRFGSVFLAVTILIALLKPVYVYAGDEDAIAIMVEQNSFDNSNVGGDGENTLLWMKGDATLSGGQLLFTNSSWQAGSVVKRNQVKLSDGFSTYFQLYFSNNADGIAFVLYKADEPKLGDNGGALGYGDKEFEYYGSDAGVLDDVDNSIHDSIIVEFDTWRNYSVTEERYDLNDAGYNNHVAIMLDGNQAHTQQSDNGAAVYTNASLSGQTINAWVDYNSGNGISTTGTVTVTFGTGATKGDAGNHTISRTIELADNTPIAGDSVFVGFTSSTGGNVTTHKLLKWYFKDAYVAGGLNPTAGTYTQSPATLSITPNNGINPTYADITIKNDAGNTMTNETFDVYIDDVLIEEEEPGEYTTGVGATYTFSIPSDLSNGTHTIRVVGRGGVTNFASFTVNKHTVTYNGNENTDGTVPVASSHNDGATVTVSSNTGSLVKEGYDFTGWNTQADGSGVTYRAGTGQIANISSDIMLYAIWSKFSTSPGNTSFITTGDAVVIDSGLSIEGFTENITGAKVMIQNKKTGDELIYINADGISGTYDSTTGVLTLAGNATPAQYQTAFRSIKFSTTSDDTTNRILLYSLGGGLYYSGNGHFYEYFNATNISWNDAQAAAESKSLYGRQGYLVTITSAEENAFVTEKVEGLGWIGAKDINNGADPDTGDWRWVTGPEGTADGGSGTQFFTGYFGHSPNSIGYGNWWSGEPNNGGGVEYVAHIFGPLNTMPGWAGGAQPGEWNDFEPGRNDGAVKGYIVEYGGMAGDTPIVVQAAKTIVISTSDVTAPTLTAGAVSRTSDTEGTVKFASDEAGSYYYAVVADGAGEPVIDTSGDGTACTTAETTITNPTGLTAGAKDIHIKVKDAAGNVSNALKIDIPAYTPSGGGSSGGTSSSGSNSGTTTQTGKELVIVIVNGKEQNAGKESNTTENGRTTIIVEVDNKVIESKIDEAIKNNPTGIGNVIQVPVTDTASEVAKIELTGDIVKKLGKNSFDVSIKRDVVEYIIPAEEFTISNVAERLGVSETDLEDIKVEIQIRKLDETVIAKYNEVAKANGSELVFPPVEFEIVAKTTKSDGTTEEVEISKFSNYVERIMEIPAGVDPSKITTGIVFNSDGTYSHVPTEVFQKDGKWYARINSLTNSEYSVIWNPITVKSVENHWAKDVVNDMASRLIIFNPETFEPNNAISRADFAEYIVRALGLYREGSTDENKFKDVSSDGERTQAILIANEYGIITGYPDGTFRPDQQITREEAMVMYQRAMSITKLTGIDAQRYQNYKDFASVSNWAEVYVKDVLAARVFNGTSPTIIAPKSNLTYAEAAQAIKNLLVESKLTNK